VEQRRAAIKTALDSSMPLLSEAAVEADDPALRRGGGIRLIEAVEVVARHLAAVHDAGATTLDRTLRTQIDAELCELDRTLGDAVDQVANCVEHGEGSVDLHALATAGEALDRRLLAIRAAHSTRAFPPAQSVVLLAFIERCKELSQAVHGVGSALAPTLAPVRGGS
jgi:hypothetical protein